MALIEKELAHFKYPIGVPGMGVAMQEKLKDSRILVVGAGGLGSPVIQYLSASGVGVIGIADYGTIQDEDMHRQPIYLMQDIRKHKAKMASSRLWASNPFTKHYPLLLQVKPENINQLLEGMDLVIDCSQNHATHLVISDACMLKGTPFVIGEVHNWVSWWAGFNIKPTTGDAPASYRCALELTDEYRNFDSGAIGVTHGATGMLIVNEVLKYIAGVPDGLANKLYSMNFLHNVYQSHTISSNATVLANTKLLTAEEYGLEIVPDIED